jgi:methylated-DNA-[protein]-cysteine S-methyltransferase
MIYREAYLSPLGRLQILANDHFVLGVDFVKNKSLNKPNHLTRQGLSQLKEYFNRQRQIFSIPIFYTGTAWQNIVWTKLLSVPYGSVISYQDLAAVVGKAKAARAVGQAVNKNPIAIIVPCHRVVGSRGDLVGYAGGLQKKQRLLLLEGLR